MAVDFPSDLILDVARAADPAKAKSVAARLSGASAADDAATAIADAAKIGRHLSRVHQSKKPEESAKEFEALLVANMIKDMMGNSETEESFFGGGFSGDVWKSMLAEQIAGQVVKSADFGVADKIAKYYVRDGDNVAAVAGVTDAAAAPLENRAVDAARNGTAEISRDFIRKMMELAQPADRG